MTVLAWVRVRAEELIEKLAKVTTEAEVVALCEEEHEYWRVGRHLVPDSMRTPNTQTKKLLRGSSLPADVKAWAVAHIDLGTETWVEMNTKQAEVLEARKEDQQLLRDPDRIVAEAEALLQTSRWQEIAAGLLLATGRRQTEILLRSTELEVHTQHTMKFTGQLKQRSNETGTFEIPVLVDATLVREAFERLRALLDTSGMNESQIENNYNRPVNQVVKHHFGDLIPARTTGKSQAVTGHTLRAVYLRLTIFWFAPIGVDSDLFAAHCAGHFSYDGGKKRLSLAAGGNYSDYKIADPAGNIDGRQGVRLGQPGVVPLERFAHIYDPSTAPAVGLDGMVSRPRVTTGALVPESLFAPGEMLTLINSGMEAAGELDFVRYLTRALKRQARLDLGILKRDTVVEVEELDMAALAKLRKPSAAAERLRRGVEAVMAYNDSHAPLERWWINPTLISRLVVSNFPAIQKWFREHIDEINAHNARYGLSAASNRKQSKIEELIKVE